MLGTQEPIYGVTLFPHGDAVKLDASQVLVMLQCDNFRHRVAFSNKPGNISSACLRFDAETRGEGKVALRVGHKPHQ